MTRRTHDEARAAILAGAEVQITIERREVFFEKNARWGMQTFGELRLKGQTGRWLKEPEIRAVTNEDEPDDAGSILRSFASWLEAGRNVNTKAAE